MWGGKEFHILGAEIRKAREPNERLCRGTGSDWQMNAWISWACDTVKVRQVRPMADDQYAMLCRLRIQVFVIASRSAGDPHGTVRASDCTWSAVHNELYSNRCPSTPSLLEKEQQRAAERQFCDGTLRHDSLSSLWTLIPIFCLLDFRANLLVIVVIDLVVKWTQPCESLTSTLRITS